MLLAEEVVVKDREGRVPLAFGTAFDLQRTQGAQRREHAVLFPAGESPETRILVRHATGLRAVLATRDALPTVESCNAERRLTEGSEWCRTLDPSHVASIRGPRITSFSASPIGTSSSTSEGAMS
jgi:hypothetical protein